MKLHEPQAGDTTMDKALSLLEAAVELLETDNRPETESWREWAQRFIVEHAV